MPEPTVGAAQSVKGVLLHALVYGTGVFLMTGILQTPLGLFAFVLWPVWILVPVSGWVLTGWLPSVGTLWAITLMPVCLYVAGVLASSVTHLLGGGERDSISDPMNLDRLSSFSFWGVYGIPAAVYWGSYLALHFSRQRRAKRRDMHEA